MMHVSVDTINTVHIWSIQRLVTGEYLSKNVKDENH